MWTVFLFCAVIGSTIFVVQFVMALVGLGHADFDVAHDIPDHFGDALDAHGHVIDHGSTWLFGVISFRTVVAALAFFGLGGIAALQANQPQLVAVVIALACGGSAMYGVHWLMRMLYRLGHDGTARIEGCVGRCGTVYVPIPGGQSGTGKIQLQHQDRIMEYQAVTSHKEKLNTGAKVVVVSIVGPTTVEVELAREAVDVANS